MTNENIKPNIGSDWRKWDLHVHTPLSICQKYGGNTEEVWEKFIDALEKLPNDIKVIGITDYYFIDGFEKVMSYRAKGRLTNIEKIFPVLEFRIDTFGSGNENKLQKINLHVLFDVDENDVKNEINKIKTEFIGQIPLTKLEMHKTKMLSHENLIAEAGDLQTGFSNFIPSTDRVFELINSTTWKDKVCLFLGYKEWSNLEKNNQLKPFKEDLYKKVKAFFSSDYANFEKNQKWLNEYGDKRLIHSGDIHDFTFLDTANKDEKSKYLHSKNYFCNTWIKAEPTFEGLKQIVYEPETRIFIGEGRPKKPINTIDSITLEIPIDAKVGEDRFCFAGNNNSYGLSSYFNCFIGGRGSGKSTILNFLGLHSNNSDSSKEFWFGNGKDKKGLNPVNFDSNVKNIFNFTGTEIFEFLAQSEIETFARDKAKFTQAVYNRANSHAGNILEEYENMIESLREKLDQIIQAVIDLKTLKDQKVEKEKEKRTLENSIKVLSSEEYNKIIIGITDKSKELQKIEYWKENVAELRDSLFELIPKSESEESQSEDGRTEYEKAYDFAIVKIREVIELLKEEEFTEEADKEGKINMVLIDLEAEAKVLIERAGYTPESVEQIKSAPQKITNLESEIGNLTLQIELKEKNIATLDDVIDELNTNKKNYEIKITEILEPLQILLKKQFESNKGKDIKQISLEYLFDEKKAWIALAKEFYGIFEESFANNEKGKGVCDFVVENSNEFLKSHNELITFLSTKGSKQYIKFIQDVFKDENNFKIFQTIRGKHLYDVKTNKIIQVKYDNKDVGQVSFGQRCTAVIVILLLFGNYPLIIDEPEAHLDSSLIANYLVPLLKEKKSDRQIIFATHNANFVINGDAEKIFILKNGSGQTEVIETTIEDIKNRKELLKLEGGKEAFEKRGKKLNIK